MCASGSNSGDRAGTHGGCGDKLPDVKTHEMPPRASLCHTWTNTQNEGWFRIEFDRLQIPYRISRITSYATRRYLRDKYDVILFPTVGGSAQGIVNGTPMPATRCRGSNRITRTGLLSGSD